MKKVKPYFLKPEYLLKGDFPVKKIARIFVFCCICFVMASCDTNTNSATTWEFDNWTRYSISITNINGSPESITLPAYGKAYTVVAEDTIRYRYRPSNRVTPFRISGKNTIRFQEL